MDRQFERLQISAGRDYNSGRYGIYEFCIFDGDDLILRGSGFKSKAQAVRAAKKAAEPMLAEALL